VRENRKSHGPLAIWFPLCPALHLTCYQKQAGNDPKANALAEQHEKPAGGPKTDRDSPCQNNSLIVIHTLLKK
jgi:hypothetical protein